MISRNRNTINESTDTDILVKLSVCLPRIRDVCHIIKFHVVCLCANQSSHPSFPMRQTFKLIRTCGGTPLVTDDKVFPCNGRDRLETGNALICLVMATTVIYYRIYHEKFFTLKHMER